MIVKVYKKISKQSFLNSSSIQCLYRINKWKCKISYQFQFIMLLSLSNIYSKNNNQDLYNQSLVIYRINPHMQNERKLIALFKTFVEKALIPYVQNIDTVMQEWNKFSTMIFSDSISYPQIKLYIDTLSLNSNVSTLDKNQLSPYTFKRPNEKNAEEDIGKSDNNKFNAKKTMGGDANRPKIYMPKEKIDEFTDGTVRQTMNSKTRQLVEESFKKQGSNSSQGLNLQQLFRVSLQNQVKIQMLTGYSEGANNMPPQQKAFY